jgi:hypothetical protein
MVWLWGDTNGKALGSLGFTKGWPKLGLALATGATEAGAAALEDGLGAELLLGFDVSPPQPVSNNAIHPKEIK